MNILIIGSGGREHALAWHAAQSPQVKRVFVAPGNAGTTAEPKTQNVPLSSTDIDQLVHFARTTPIDLTIVGPEAPLAAGIVDAFQKQGLYCLGPTQQAARLESSKSFCKAFLQRHGIPTAHYATFTAITPATAYVRQCNLPIVIKADGLAAGKGVTIAYTLDEALAAIEQELTSTPTRPTPCIVIEEFLTGEEVSYIVLADGKHVIPFASSQDHKARDEGDRGPNTGGMGAYSPAPIITPELEARILETIIYPTLQGMAKEGTPYVGFLYAGLMITPQGEPKVLEFNCRLGDPEAQVLLMRLQSDLVALCQAALKGTVAQQPVIWDPRPALGVVLANRGYPHAHLTGAIIHGLNTIDSAKGKVFHAGTQRQQNDVLATGGRVLCCVGLGDTIELARDHAYQLVDTIHWEHKYYRRDIGHRAMK